MRCVLVTAALFVLVLVSSPAAASRSAPSQTSEQTLRADLERYHGMVVAYRRGDDKVISELLTWDASRLELTIGSLNSPKLDPNQPWSDAFLRSGVLLQTAAALNYWDARNGSRMTMHFNLGVAHLRLGSSELDWFSSRWYYAVSRALRARNDVSEAERILETARKQLPADPLILYESATIEETRATEWHTENIHSWGSFHELDALAEGLKERTTRLQTARDWLRQSVAKAATPLSRLHFGRVLMMLKEDAPALDQLEAVPRETEDRATQYLAFLYIAAVQERAGRLDAAAKAYRRAIDCFPEADVAYIGLSEVLQSMAQGDEARHVLQELLKPRPARHEPWTWYFLEPQSVARERLVLLLEEGPR
jgi:tetratricopeptide (TPR) repeat protein